MGGLQDREAIVSTEQQTTEALPPLPPGFENYQPVQAQGSSGTIPPLPPGYENYQSPEQAPKSWLQTAWEGFGKNVLPEGHPLANFANRMMSNVKGFAETVGKQPEGKDEQLIAHLPMGPGAVPLYRMIKGQVEAEKTLGPQVVEQAKASAASHAGQNPALPHLPTLEDARTATTALSMLNPFASSSVANVNTLQDQGQGGKATGEGLADAAMLGTGLIKMPEAPASAVPKTAPIEALATVIDDRGGAVDPHAIASDIHPVLSNQAALDGLDLSKLEGRQVGQAVIKTVDNAVKSHQAQVAQITKPYEKVLVDQSPIAQAYLDQRTPELRRNDPAAAARLLQEARHYAGVDNNGVITGAIPAPLSDVNAFRIRLNNETAAAQGKSEGAYRKTDWETKADVKALIAARDVQYGTLARVSGLPEETIRTLQTREGQLMETRDGLTKEFNKVSASQAEAVAGSLKANPPGSGRFITAAREKVGHTYPSRHGVERSVIREVVGPKPIETFNNRMKLAFSEPGPGTAPPTYAPAPGGGIAAKPQVTPPQPPVAPVSTKVGGAKVLAGDVPLTGAVSPVAADITRLKGELKTATDPKEIADIQQALQHAQARLEGRPFQPPSQAEVEGLPAQQPRTVEPGPSSRGGASQSLPRLRQVEQPRNPAATAPSSRSAGLPGPERAIAVAAAMRALKNGEITQAEADKRIQRANGGGGRKLVRMPQPPND